MGRKKRRAHDKEARIFCWYCERDFASEHELVHHQKEKHLRCPTCNKRMVSTSGLVIHAMQVHKRAVTVPNAIDGREDPKVDVFGMQGIPAAALSNGGLRDKRQRTEAPGAAATVPFVVDAPTPAPGAPVRAPYVAYPAQSYAPYQQAPALPQSASYAPFSYQYPVAQVFPAQQAAANAPPPAVVAPAWASRPPHPASLALQNRPVLRPAAGGVQVATPAAAPTLLASRAVSGAPHSAAAAEPASPNAAVAGSATAVAAVRGEAVPFAQARDKPTAVAVFGRQDISMEELRARLPRYRAWLKEA
jgi:DNA-directed RNA polymerase subunit RPC12/RpoP